jgi:hypothetical protein
MRSKVAITLSLTLLLTCSLFLFVPAKAQATGQNLEPFSVFVSDMDTSYQAEDFTVTHNGDPSIHAWYNAASPDDPDGYVEDDGAWISVSPGDQIETGCWVMTSALSNPTDQSAGANYGFDFYANTNLGYGIVGAASDNSASHPDSAELNWGVVNGFGYTGGTQNVGIVTENGMEEVSGYVCRIPYNTGWTLIEWDFIVPTQTFDWVWGVNNSGANGYNTGTAAQVNPVYIDSMVTWFGGRDVGDKYYSDTYLYDLGQTSLSGSSSPTPTPSASPYPSPVPTTARTPGGTPTPFPTASATPILQSSAAADNSYLFAFIMIITVSGIGVTGLLVNAAENHKRNPLQVKRRKRYY